MIAYAVSAVLFTLAFVIVLVAAVAGWHWLEERISEYFQR